MRSLDSEAQKDYIAVLQLSKRQRMYCTIRMQVAYDLPPLPPLISCRSQEALHGENCGLFKDIENTLVQGASKCFRKLGGVNTTTIIREHFIYFKNLITNSTTNKKIKWYKRLKNENSNQIMIPLNSLKECI